MNPLELRHPNDNVWFRRALSAMKMMGEGKFIKLPDGSSIGMGDNYTIGYLCEVDGEHVLSPMSEITFATLMAALKRHDCIIIPEVA